MKTFIAAALCLAFLFCPIQARAQQPPKCTLVECGMALVVLTIGGVTVYHMIRLCKKLPPIEDAPPPPTNAPPVITNHCSFMPPARASTWGNSVTLQSSSDGRRWQTTCALTFSQPGDGTMVAVLSKAGVPAATNAAPLVMLNGEPTAVLDFSTLALTNRGAFFRISNP